MAKKDLKKGVLITFEGPEGSGKSTQVRLLCSHLRRKGFKVLHLREPGGTAIGEKIRKVLLAPANKQMDAICEMLLYQAARAQLVKEKILPALKQGKVVILDRFLDATICYQGYGARLDINLIRQIGRFATRSIQPDLTILLDIGAKEGLQRVRGYDRIERKPLEFHRRVRRGYLQIARANPHRIKIVPADRDIIRSQAIIRGIVERRLTKY